jgi:hypothetical protein
MGVRSLGRVGGTSLEVSVELEVSVVLRRSSGEPGRGVSLLWWRPSSSRRRPPVAGWRRCHFVGGGVKSGAESWLSVVVWMVEMGSPLGANCGRGPVP